MENSEFFVIKMIIQFLERIFYQQNFFEKDINKDWQIVLAQLKATINHSCVEDHGLKIFIKDEN